jgi:hypothetical protein
MIDLMQLFEKYCSSKWNEVYTSCYSQGPLQTIYQHSNYLNLTDKNIEQYTYILDIEDWNIHDLIKYEIEGFMEDADKLYEEMGKELYAKIGKEEIELIMTANEEGEPQEEEEFYYVEIPGVVKKITLNKRLFEEDLFKSKVQNISLDAKIYRNDKAYDAIIVTIDDKQYDFEIKEAT